MAVGSVAARKFRALVQNGDITLEPEPGNRPPEVAELSETLEALVTE